MPGAAPASPIHTKSPAQPREKRTPTPCHVSNKLPPCTHAALTCRPHHPPGVLLEYRFILVHQGAAAAPHGGILGRKGPFRAGQGWAPHGAPSPVPPDRAEPARAAATHPSIRERVFGAEREGQAGGSNLFSVSERGGSLQGVTPVENTVRSVPGHGHGWESRRWLGSAVSPPRICPPGDRFQPSQRSQLPLTRPRKMPLRQRSSSSAGPALPRTKPPREPLTCPPRHRD